MNPTHGFTFGDFVWWIGEVINRKDDPEKIGRVRVRIFGYHDNIDKKIKDDDLPWAIVVQRSDSAASKEIGNSPTGFIEGTIVVGFFADGNNAQAPVVIGSLQGVPGGKPDSHKLARGEELGSTIIQTKKDEITDSNTSDNPWKEIETPAAPKYPHNQMRATEAEHIEEFDDTEGAVRYGLWHPAKTWTEVHPDGTKVEKIQKDRYQITLGDEYIHVEGDVKVNIFGDAKVVIVGDAYTRVGGDRKEIVRGNYDLTVLGKYDVRTLGETKIQSIAPMKIRSTRIDLNDQAPEPPEIPELTP